MAILPTSLRSRLAVLFAVGSTVMMLVLVVALYVVLDRALLGSVDRGLRTRFADLAQIATDEDGDVPSSDPFAQVVTLDGVVTSPSTGPGHVASALTPDQLGHIGTGQMFQVDVPVLGGSSRVLARPITVQGEPRVLVVGSSLDSYMRTREKLALVLLVASPVMIAALAGSGWLLAGAALRPVRRMSEETQEISVNELDRRLAVPASHDEIEHLASTINGLLERVEQSVRHERRFVDDASHELRTPISILRGELELALARPGDHDEVVAALESALDETLRLGRLADDLLVLARSRTGELALHPRAVDLGAAATRVGRLLAEGVPVDVEGSAQAWADPDRVEQILLNLVTNAKRHAAARVVVTVRELESRAELTVADDGSGFPASIMPVTFERFVRPDSARGRVNGGTGLGLSIAATLARSQGATIEAGNQSPLGGAWVRLVFPGDPGAGPSDVTGDLTGGVPGDVPGGVAGDAHPDVPTPTA
ncbi:MAG: ATP-binding protein [Acidimicrobiales bacterium]